MTRRKGPRFEPGDVFTIPIDAERVGFGQIAAEQGTSGGHFYLAVFAGAYPRSESPDLDEVVRGELALFALSMDALLFHGRWEVVGHRDVRADLPWPAYKLGVSPPGTFEVVDAAGTRRRPATPEEIARLPYRTTVAPIRVEKAFQALHGVGDWLPHYDALRPVAPEQTSRMAFDSRTH